MITIRATASSDAASLRRLRLEALACVPFVKLAVVTTNTPAVRCYARCGFAVYGIEPQAICYDGVFYDELLMAKQFS
jgi:hypothetical protein